MKQIYAIIITLLLITSCSSPQKYTAEHYTYETECLGIDMDGTQTVKVWGKGIDANSAKEQALKNAVNDVLFKGIRKGKTDCDSRPIILEANARQNHESYFDKFFVDKGAYLDYIVGGGKNKHYVSAVKHRSKNGSQTFSLVVRVKRGLLREKMLNDIINKK